MTLHVLILPSWYPRIATNVEGSFFREQALALSRTGTKVGVVATSLGSMRSPLAALKSSYSIRFENDNGLPTYRYTVPNVAPRQWWLNSRRILNATRKVFWLYVEEHGWPDIIHVHSLLNAGHAARAIGEETRIPYVILEHSTAFQRGLVPRAKLSDVRLASSQANGRFAVSSALAWVMGSTLGESAGRWCVVPNPVSDIFLERALAAPPASPVFVHVSTLERKKNVQMILRAFARAFWRGRAQLRIGGNGNTLADLRRLAKELDIERQVRFLGHLSRSEVREAIEGSTAFVLSSDHETFGVVLVESMALGRPVIATRCGGPENVVTPETGLLVDKGDVEGLAEAMKTIATAPGRFDSKVVRASCAARYSAASVMRRWTDIYAAILSSHEPRSPTRR